MAPVMFFITYIILAGLRPEYSMYYKAVSELGDVDAPYRWWWNVFGYILPGLLVSGWAFRQHPILVTGGGGRLALWGLITSGLMMALSGIFPGDFENRQSITMLLHSVGSFGSYVGFLMAAFVYPRVAAPIWQPMLRRARWMAWLSVAAGSWPMWVPEYPAIGQRVVFACYWSWMIYLSVSQLRRRTST